MKSAINRNRKYSLLLPILLLVIKPDLSSGKSRGAGDLLKLELNSHDVDSIVTDTTAALTRCVWTLKKSNNKVVTRVSEIHHQPDGRFKIVINRNTPEEESGLGMWRRKGKFIYMEIDGFPRGPYL